MTGGGWRRAAAVTGAMLLATAVFFHRALISGEVFIARDILRVYYPLRSYWAQRVLNGSFPDWFPFDGLGEPFAGMVISGVFHPINLTYLVLPLKVALTVNVLICFPAACAGVYAMARRFGADVAPAVLGGLAFAFSGHLVSSTSNLLYLMAAATVPWAVWGADRFLERPCWPRASAAGGLAALVLLAGDVQAFALTLGLFAVLAFCRRAPPVAAVVLLLSAVAASVVQLVPTWQVLGQARPGRQRLAEATVWSMHPLRLVELLLGPFFARDPGDSLGTSIARRLLDTGKATLWVDSVYLGLPVVALALLGAWTHRRSRTGRALLLCTVTLLLLALGKRAGLDVLAFHLVPLWSAFRYPEKWMAYVSLGLALGAVAGFQAVLQEPALRRRAGVVLTLCGVLALALGVEESWIQFGGRWMAVRSGVGARVSEATTHLAGELAHGAQVTGALCLLVGLTLVWARRPALLAWAAPACTFLALLSLNEPRYQLSFAEVVERPSPFLAAVQGTPWRVLHLGGAHLEPTGSGLSAVDRHALGTVMALEPVTPSLFGVEGANTYLPAVSTRVLDLSDDERAWVLERSGLFATRFLSVAQQNEADLVAAGRRLVETLPSYGYFLFEDPSALPRAYVASPICVASASASLAAVRERHFIPGREAVVECERPLQSSPGASGEVTAMAFTPERVVLQVRMDGSGVLVLNDAFYSGWRATVDGAPEPILAANHAVRAVALGAGTHEVVFRYRTPGLWAGLCITAVFLLGGVIASGVRRRAARVAGATVESG